MISGFNVASVNHDSRIDWLEVRNIHKKFLIIFYHFVFLYPEDETVNFFLFISAQWDRKDPAFSRQETKGKFCVMYQLKKQLLVTP